MHAATMRAAVLAILAAPLRSLAIDVRSCEEFEAVDRKVETEVTIITAGFLFIHPIFDEERMVLKSTVGATLEPGAEDLRLADGGP